MKYFIFFLFLIYSCFDVYGQLDTIRLSEIKSDNVFIIADVKDLIECFGVPDFIHEDKQYRYNRKSIYSTDKDTVFYFNLWTYYKNYKYIMSYIEKEGKVRLRNFDFKINKEAVIYTPKLKLSRKLRLSELMQAYQYTDEDIGKIITPLLLPPFEKSRRVYYINFSTGEHEEITIELLFDYRKKLRMMGIGAYGF
jgi:hypothetical protein